MEPRPPGDIEQHRSKILRTQLLIGESVSPATFLRVLPYQEAKYLIHLKAQFVINENWNSDIYLPSYVVIEWKDIDAPTIFSESHIANIGPITEQDEISLIGWQLFHWTNMYLDMVALLRHKGLLADRSLTINSPHDPIPHRFSRIFLE